jgi:putative flippase GtrA
VRALSAVRATAGLWRYYQAAIVNTVFGYSLYALLVAVGLNMYAAQLVGHVLGVTFNYFTYSRHAFRGTEGSKLRFVMAYAGHYLVSLTMLAASARVVSSPYTAGLLALILASLLNYFVLKNLVFTKSVIDSDR